MAKEIKEEKNSAKEISWRAAEYEYVPKSALWYLIIIVVALILTIISLFQRNFFFAVFIIIATAMVIFLGRRRPAVINFGLTAEGVRIDKILLSFENLENFSIRRRPGYLDEIVLKKKAAVNPFVRMPIDSKTAEEARQFLSEYLEEVEYKESLVDIFSEWLRF
jgi:c-di-AMP phosphodiesterase-like protein